VQITFIEADIKLTSFPHMDAMVITAHKDKWNVTSVLVDNGSQAETLFLSTFEQMGFSKEQFKEALKPLYGFGGKRIEPIGSISLPMYFGSLSNTRTEYITFDVVDMSYTYNAIFRRGLLNTFEAALHSLYGSQKDARNIEQGFAPGHKNVNCLQDEKAENYSSIAKNENEGSPASSPIEPKCETKRVPLDPRVPDITVMISQDLTSNEETELLSFLDKNNDVLMWKTTDLTGVSRDIIEYKLQFNPSAKHRKQRLHKMSDEMVVAAKVEVQRLLDAGFICEVQYPSWLTNVVMGKCWRSKNAYIYHQHTYISCNI
jgi:hypothetical protein